MGFLLSLWRFLFPRPVCKELPNFCVVSWAQNSQRLGGNSCGSFFLRCCGWHSLEFSICFASPAPRALFGRPSKPSPPPHDPLHMIVVRQLFKNWTSSPILLLQNICSSWQTSSGCHATAPEPQNAQKAAGKSQ